MKEKLKSIGLGVLILLSALFVIEKLDIEWMPLAEAAEPACLVFYSSDAPNSQERINEEYAKGYRVVGFSFGINRSATENYYYTMCKP